MSLTSLGATALIKASELTNRTYVLPLVVFSPTSRCNSRCLSCDWWQSTGDTDLEFGEIRTLANELAGLGTRLVVFSGGEPLLRTDLFAIAQLFRAHGMELHLLTSGLALARHAESVASHFGRVTISLDHFTRDGYARVRGVNGLDAVAEGVARLRSLSPPVAISARATLHRHNFRAMPDLVALAERLGLSALSFLAADVLSLSFGRHSVPAPMQLSLTRDEVAEFRDIVERVLQVHARAFDRGLMAESPARLRRLPDYYAALLGDGPFPPVSCNAPWASVVVEADGAVRPCFFHPPVGNLREHSLETLVRLHLPRFRAGLDVSSNATCQRCVCSLNVRWRHRPWA